MKRKLDFLNRLPATTRARLLDLSSQYLLLAGATLAVTDAPTGFVYFPADGVISLSPRIGAEYGPHVMLIGAESMLGAHVQIGMAKSPLDATVALAGSAHRIGAADYVRLLHHDSALRNLSQRATGSLLRNTALAAVCLHRHPLAARLARLLLELADRERHDVFSITHASLAGLLGARREGISLQAELLQQLGLIAYRRGRVTLVDTDGLKDRACLCYATARLREAARWRN
ncbi:MAG: helix-turn-helix domain-containing protein [Burkholderiales bacterium]|nr:helix-turn-helix domain-containing protein [Burkholderiales bacterium]